ncbi:MAG: hypothetical protein WD969_17430 [Paracoccaceae bacterium]
MKGRATFLGLAAALCAHPGYAADGPIRIRASDIAYASQLRIDLGEAGFEIERTGPRQVDLVADGAGTEFDLTEIFPGALARRVVSARPMPGEAATRLRFLLNCDCDYAARISGGVLAIEFRDPSTPAGSKDDPLELEDDQTARTRIAGNAGATAPRFSPAPRGRSATPALDPVAAALVAAPDDLSEPPAEEIVIARQRLLEQLSRAADQGLLEFSSPEAAAAAPPAPDEPMRKRQRDPEPDLAAKIPAPAPEPAPPALAEPPSTVAAMELLVRARTAIDRDFPADRSDTIVDRAPCIADARLDAPSWPDAARFSSEHARLSASLLDDFDNPEPGAATDLARLYIVAGFGVEARAVIDLYGAVIDDPDLLRDLAAIAGGRTPAPNGPIATAGPCSGQAAIWFLASGLQPPAQPDAAEAATAAVTDAMIKALAESPVPLRLLLGPPLMTNLANRGEIETARRIDLLLRRVPGDHGPGVDLARARLMILSDETEAAEALFLRLGRRDLPEAREALLLLLDSRIRRGAPIDTELTEALAEAAFIARGGPMARALKIAEIRARARSEGLGPALATVREALARTPSNAIILRDAGHAALEDASAAETGQLAYVRAVLAHRDDISTDMAGDAARRRIAEEMTGIGLANGALAILDPALQRGAPGSRRAAARARIALGDEAEAFKALDGLEGVEAARLRAAAEEVAERPAAAMKTLAGLEAGGDHGGAEARAELALRAGAWAEASAAGTPEHRLLAAFMAGPEAGVATRPSLEVAAAPGAPGAAAAFFDPPRVEGEVTLGAAQSVMDASRAVRAVIEEALNDG